MSESIQEIIDLDPRGHTLHGFEVAVKTLAYRALAEVAEEIASLQDVANDLANARNTWVTKANEALIKRDEAIIEMNRWIARLGDLERRIARAQAALGGKPVDE